LLPVVRLGRVFGTDTPGGEAPRHLLVLSAEGQRFGLVVDRVRDTEEIVVKPLRQQLREGGLFAGATVRGDGRVALILDVMALAARAGLGRLGSSVRPKPAAPMTPEAPLRSLLLVRTRRGESVAVPVGEVDRIVELEARAFERFGARPAFRFEGRVLPARV